MILIGRLELLHYITMYGVGSIHMLYNINLHN